MKLENLKNQIMTTNVWVEQTCSVASAIYVFHHPSFLVGAEVYVLWLVVKQHHVPFILPPTMGLKQSYAKEMLDMQALNYINGDVEPVSPKG
uniref:Uncharacterized protein n=1 Tax=Timema cristinae TaxID=61476 RepID=A0A7R9D0T6_TIMCR|nr:unnamed protein product [Timema cristinae]